MNYGDHQIVKQIVGDVGQRGNGSAALVAAFVQPVSFRAKSR